MGNKISRRTQGGNQLIFVAKNQAEAGDVDIQNFVASATLGEIAAYDANGDKHTNAITASEYVQFYQKMTDGVRKTPLMKFSDIVARKTAYTAAAKWAAFVGFTGSAGSLNLADAPDAGVNYEIAVIELTEGNHPFPTWNYNYTAKAGDVELDVVLALAKQINNGGSVLYDAVEQPVTAQVRVKNSSYTNYTMNTGGTMVFTQGSDTVVLDDTYNAAVGDFIAITTGASAVADDTVTNVYKILATDGATYITLDRPYEEASRTFVEAAADGTATAGGSIKKIAGTVSATGLKLTAVNDTEHFKVARREELQNATYALSAYTRGNGTAAEVAEMEEAGIVMFGETTNAVELASKWGQQDRFVDAAGAYQIYNIEWYPQSDEKSGFSRGKTKTLVTIAAHNSNTSFKTYLDTLLGL